MGSINRSYITATILTSAFAFAVGLLSNQARAEEAAEDICTNTNIQTITSKISESSSKNFNYKFAFYKAEIDPENKNVPVLIYIPGGPGQTSINYGNFDLNQKNHIIMTDPRGNGCNRSQFKMKDLTSMAIATDIVGTIYWLKNNGYSHYTIMGTSYGTVVATILEYLIEQKSLPRPSAIILNSTFSNYTNDMNSGYINFWEKLKRKLDPATLGVIKNKDSAYPKEISDQIKYGILGLLVSGTLLTNGDDNHLETAQDFLKDALNGGKPPFSETFAGMAQDLQKDDDPNLLQNYIFDQIACTELADCKYTLTMQNGNMVHVLDKRKLPALIKKYNSADYPIHVPIYYFIGTSDPATPIEQTYHHLRTQTSTERNLVVVPEFGHDIVDRLSCRNDVVDDIVNEHHQLTQVLKNCGTKLEYQKFPALNKIN